MDNTNAGGDLRGNRAELTKELRELLSDEYGFEKSTEYTDLNGSSSLNLYAKANQIQYVVRVYRPYVTSERLDDIISIRAELNEHGIPFSKTCKNINGQNYTVWNGRLVEVEYFVENNGIMDTIEKLKHALPIFGQITSVLSGITNISTDSKKPLFANYINFEQIAEMTEKGCNRILSWNPTDCEHEIIYKSKILCDKIIDAGGKTFNNLPKQLSHGDFWDNNVLFNNDSVVLITDLDFMGERRRIEDIALTLYFSHISERYCKSEDMSTERAVELKQLLNIYESGLDMPLTEAEKAALPTAIALQALWGIGGWVVLLDDDNAARVHASAMMWELERCNYILDNLSQWQDIFSA